MTMSPSQIELADASDRQVATASFDHNLVVTAGAGTGKTTLLVDRLVHLLLRNLQPLKISKTGKVESVPVGRFDFVASQPWSLSNYRLIAANWLSTNILSYAFLLVVLSLLIGVTTASMLSRLGRRE